MKNSLTEQICPICGPTLPSILTQSDERLVLRCVSCGLIFSSPRPSTADISRFFQSEYIEDERRAAEDFTAYRASALKTEASCVRSMLPQGGRLLDVGCASGAFMAEMARDSRWTVSGIEPSRFAAGFARSTHGLDVYCGFLRDAALTENHYDVVTSLDSFYFHPEPNEDLREIRRILRPGGLLVVEIPGLQFRLLKNTGILSRLIYGVPARLNARLHLFFYSSQTLTALASRHDFALLRKFPQQGPLYGSAVLRIANHAYYWLFSRLYTLTGGRLNLAPKELLIFRSMKSAM